MEMSVGWTEIVLLALACIVAALSAAGLFRRERRLGLGAAALLLLTAVMLGHGRALHAALDHQTPGILALSIARTMGALWWGLAAWLLVTLFETMIQRTLFPSAGQPRARKIFSDLFAGLIYLLALFGIVTFVFDEPLTSVVATSGVIAIVLGLALQSTLNDLFSGLALNIELPFRAGDWITVGGEPDGQVIEINWRATRIQTRAGDIMIIPNSLMTKLRVTNHYPASRGHVSTIRVELDGAIDPALVLRALEEAAATSMQVRAGTSPHAVMRRYGDAGIVYELHFIIADFAGSVQAESVVLQAMWAALGRIGVRGAFPLRQIAVAGPGRIAGA